MFTTFILLFNASYLLLFFTTFNYTLALLLPVITVSYHIITISKQAIMQFKGPKRTQSLKKIRNDADSWISLGEVEYPYPDLKNPEVPHEAWLRGFHNQYWANALTGEVWSNLGPKSRNTPCSTSGQGDNITLSKDRVQYGTQAAHEILLAWTPKPSSNQIKYCKINDKEGNHLTNLKWGKRKLNNANRDNDSEQVKQVCTMMISFCIC